MNRNEKLKLKLFVGGYYDDRIFEGEEFDGKTPFNKDIDTYTYDEVLKLGFVEPVKELDFYLDELLYERKWNDLSIEEQIESIIEYVSTDSIAGLLFFDTEEKANKYKEEVLKELNIIEENIEYVGKQQDDEGYFREVYKLK